MKSALPTAEEYAERDAASVAVDAQRARLLRTAALRAEDRGRFAFQPHVDIRAITHLCLSSSSLHGMFVPRMHAETATEDLLRAAAAQGHAPSKARLARPPISDDPPQLGDEIML